MPMSDPSIHPCVRRITFYPETVRYDIEYVHKRLNGTCVTCGEEVPMTVVTFSTSPPTPADRET